MKNLLVAALGLSSLFAFGQNPQVQEELCSEFKSYPAFSSQSAPYNGPETLIWSEEFSNGIPSTWFQNGSSANVLWEYRGPNTAPNNNSGSRGFFSGINNNPPTNTPLSSASNSNGFVIFDSGYLDNGGSSNLGSGAAPAPHIGRLFTDTIDLSNYPDVVLSFQSYARRFIANFYVAISTDHGLNWNDTLEVFPTSQIPINASTNNGVLSTLNISNIAGGKDSVQLQFIFDGTPGNVNGNGYYFWMLDDIELRAVSPNSLNIVYPAGFNSQNLIVNPAVPNYPIYGTMHSDQIVPIAGNMSVVNDGSANQSNVMLEIDVINRANGQIVHTLQSSTGCSTLLSGDTCWFSNLETSPWTPPANSAQYALVYRVTTDSMQGANAYHSPDTLFFEVSDDLYSLDAGQADNFMGTLNAVPNIISEGVLFSLENEDPDSTGSGKVFIDGVQLYLSALSDSTGSILFEIYDTSNFAFSSGFPGGTAPIYSKVHSLSASDIGHESFFSFQSSSSTSPLPLSLNTGSYLLVVNFFPAAPNGQIALANEQSFDQPGISSVMQLSDGTWFGAFANSRNFESPHIALRMADLSLLCPISRDTLLLANCTGQPIISPSGNYTYQQSGFYHDTLLNAAGCDSILYLEIQIGQIQRDSILIQVCDSTSYRTPSGIYLSQPGIYYDTIPGQFGCDSIIEIDLHFGSSNQATDTLEINTCGDPYQSPSGQVYTQSGFYVDTLANLSGCDSLIPIDLQITHINTTVNTILNGTGLVANQVNAQYQWYDCSNNGFQAMPGDTNQIFTPQLNGQYAVVIQMGSCQDTSDCTLIEDIGLATSELLNFALYPNPSQGLIHIEGLENENYALQIHDLQGRKVFEQEIRGTDKKEIDLSHLNKGLYQISLKKTHQSGHQMLLLD